MQLAVSDDSVNPIWLCFDGVLILKPKKYLYNYIMEPGDFYLFPQFY